MSKSKPCCVPNCKDRSLTRHSIPRKPISLHQEWLRRIQNDRLKNLTPQQIWKRHRVCDIHFTNANRIQDLSHLREYSVPSLNLPGFEDGVLSDFFTGKVEENYGVTRSCCVPNCEDRESVRHHIPRDPHGYHLEFVRRVQNNKLKILSPSQISARYIICDKHFSNRNKIAGVKRLRTFSLPTLFLPDGLRGEVLSKFYEETLEEKNAWQDICSVPTCFGHVIKHCIPYAPLSYHQEWVRRIKNDLMNDLSAMEICKRFYVCNRHFSSAVRLDNMNLRPFSLPTLNLPYGSGEELSDFFQETTSNPSGEQLNGFFPEELLSKSGNNHQYIKNKFKPDTIDKNAEHTNSDDEDDCIQYWIVITA